VTHTAQPKDTRTDDIVAQVDPSSVVMMQSLARGFLARSKVERMKQQTLAKEGFTAGHHVEYQDYENTAYDNSNVQQQRAELGEFVYDD
jgi:hypothetical protein